MQQPGQGLHYFLSGDILLKLVTVQGNQGCLLSFNSRNLAAMMAQQLDPPAG